MWAWWVVGGLVAWFVVATMFALLLGASIRLRDRRSTPPAAFTPMTVETSVRVPTAVSSRRRFPLPPVGVALVAIATALMVSGYVVRVSGSTGPAAQMLSMDAPLSLPRTFVAGLFAIAAIAAAAGAARNPGRRTWWASVSVVTAGIAAVKADGMAHTLALQALGRAVTPLGALLISVVAAAGIVVALWVLSRHERRDRRRILGVLTLYGLAAVGLSAVSSTVAGAYGSASTWAAAATLIEETSEALAAVAVLIGVLVGVAPRLVLPRDWVLQREADALSLDVPAQLPGGAAQRGPAAG